MSTNQAVSADGEVAASRNAVSRFAFSSSLRVRAETFLVKHCAL